MDPNYHDQLNDFEWQIIEDEINDDSIEEQMIRIIEKSRQKHTQNSSRQSMTRTHIERGREEGHVRLFNDYFSDNSVYTDIQFRRRFRMRRRLFLRIVEALSNYDEYFQQKVDATGRMGLSPIQKCTTVIRILAYGSPVDCVDEYVRVGGSTAVECLEIFVKGVNDVFGGEYLRKPNNNYIQYLLQLGEAREFSSMLGSIDCMHWAWKNCPVAWKSQFSQGDHGKPTIILEAVASRDLWIWHAYFGVAGSNNDINVLNQSNIFNNVLEEKSPEVQFMMNETEYNMGYYLADGIYPECATFVKSIPMPQGDKRKLFDQHQEATRKDAERAFGVLQSRFAIVRGSTRAWHMNIIKLIMSACIILHNMIVEDERDAYEGNFTYSYDNDNNEIIIVNVSNGAHPNLATYLQRRANICDKQFHRHLQSDFVEYIWKCYGQQFSSQNNV